MSSNINSVVVSGNVTRDPELRSTPSGVSVLAVGLAVNDARRDQNGGWEDYTNFFDVNVFGKRAEGLAHILEKGMKICVKGKLRYSTWERDGQRRSKVEIVADDVELMQRRASQDGPSAPQQGNPVTSPGYGQNGPQNASGGFSGYIDQYYDDPLVF